MMRQMRLPHFPPFSSLLMCTIVISRRMRSIVKSTRSMPFALPMRITLSASNPIKSGSIKTSRAHLQPYGHGMTYISSAMKHLKRGTVVSKRVVMGLLIRYHISQVVMPGMDYKVSAWSKQNGKLGHVSSEKRAILSVVARQTFSGSHNAYVRIGISKINSMAVLRHIALNLLKHEPSKLSIQSKRLQAACDNKYLEKVIKMQTPY